MGFPIAVAVLLAFVAGCSTPAPDPLPPEPVPAETADALAFGEPRHVATIPNTQHETFLAVSPDGRTLLACAHGEFVAPAHMYASTDGGATFAELDAGPGLLPAGDCEVALGPEGAWSFAGNTVVGVTVATTLDQGRSWTVNHLTGPPLNGLADRPWLAYADQTLLLSYQPGTPAVGSVRVARSTDFGATWTSPVEVAASTTGSPFIDAADFVVSADNQTVRIPVTRQLSPGGSATLSFAVSRDAGATWAEESVAEAQPPAEGFPGVAITSDGTLTWVYDAGGRLVALTSSDDGATWSEPREIATGTAWSRPWASARPDGSVDIVWLSDGSQFNVSEVGLGLTRIAPGPSGPVSHRMVASVGFIEFASVAHDASGRAHISVVDAPQAASGDVSLQREGRLLIVQEVLAEPAGAGIPPPEPPAYEK